ncbi:2'-5' RNA ligase family protein [Pedococcus sp. 2YAF34]|uniref:2'-5' RNA ligase family protein n=1 Tax=Pedococcus sp. 2YAF34 TaxID=3233032 RepID=UPI003F9554DF
MLLHAAFFPPHEAVAELADVVRSVAGHQREFTPVSVDDMHVHVTSFGNLARADAAGLADRLVAAAADWAPAPRLSMAGCSALAGEGDLTVCAPLAGQVDQLRSIARAIPEVVQTMGLHVDRRRFKPQVPVGEVTADTSLPYLERLVGALEGYRGPEWVLPDLVLLKPSWASADHETSTADIYAVIPLGAPQASA